MTGQAGWHDTSGPYFGGNTGHRRIRQRAAHLGLLALLLPFSAAAQTLVIAKPGEKLPSFEVAAIRADSSGSGSMRMDGRSDIFRAENTTLKNLIMDAWEIRSNAQISGGPEDLLDRHFDVDARISQDDLAAMAKLSREERSRYRSLMLQSMLVDRFRLATHIETKEEPVFALVVAKGGPKFEASVADPPKDATKPPDPHAPPSHGEGTWMNISTKGADLEAHHAKLESLASMIAFQPEANGRVVVDKTGLTGDYDYTIKWTPEWMSAHPRQSDALLPDTEPAGPSLFTALQDQLGLKMVPEKAPIQVLVIDHVEPPTAN